LLVAGLFAGARAGLWEEWVMGGYDHVLSTGSKS
jgi:hypothetical protein